MTPYLYCVDDGEFSNHIFGDEVSRHSLNTEEEAKLDNPDNGKEEEEEGDEEFMKL